MINIAHLMGRIGSKKIKPLTAGGAVCTLSIVTTKRHIDSHSGQRKDVDTWHFVNLYNKLAEIAEKYTEIGDLIFVSGEIQNRKIEDGSGSYRWLYSISAHDIKLLPNNKNDSTKKAPIDDSIGNRLEDDEHGDVPF